MSTPILLSVCIATYSRAKFLAETLDSIVPQLSDSIELVILDGASPDNTEMVVAPYLIDSKNIRYIRAETNSGVDQDYDNAVGYAIGTYCWLMTDDDILMPDAISSVIKRIESDPDLLVVNAECWNADLSLNLKTKMINSEVDRAYTSKDVGKAFSDLASCLSFIGSVVIRRDLWMARDRVSYYGTLFCHVGVIFQRPQLGTILTIAKPLMKIRYGNSMWTPRSFEIWYFKWPNLIWSFVGVDDNSKELVYPKEPWRSLKRLAKSRAMGDYTYNEFSQFLSGKKKDINFFMAFIISISPAILLNTIALLYYSIKDKQNLYTIYDLTRSKNSSYINKLIKIIFS